MRVSYFDIWLIDSRLSAAHMKALLDSNYYIHATATFRVR